MPFEEDEKANFVLIISALNFMIFISITSISGSKQQSRTAKIIEKKMLKKKKKFFKKKEKNIATSRWWPQEKKRRRRRNKKRIFYCSLTAECYKNNVGQYKTDLRPWCSYKNNDDAYNDSTAADYDDDNDDYNHDDSDVWHS